MKFKDAPTNTVLRVGNGAYVKKTDEPVQADSGMMTNALWVSHGGVENGTCYIPADLEVDEVHSSSNSPVVADSADDAVDDQPTVVVTDDITPQSRTGKRSGG